MPLPNVPTFRLDGKRALVVGASSGIGLGCAVAIADAGAEVTLCARSLGRLTEVEQEMRGKGWDVRSIALDVSDIARTGQLVDENGPFDVMVNSAGTARHSLAVETDPDGFDTTFDLNVRGAYFLTRAVAKGLLDAGKPGSLINISSQMAHVGGANRAVYCGSKHAVEGFTKSMAIEWGPMGIRVNTVCPTFIRTPLTTPTFSDPKQLSWIKEKIKLGRVGEVEDIMGPVLMLASDAGSMITGASILVDGGWTAG